MEMDELLTEMDRTSANLAKLEDLWRRAAPFLPTGPSRLTGTAPIALPWDRLDDDGFQRLL